MGVALWLCPRQSSQIYDTLTSLSMGLYPLVESPRFEPHITITSQLAVNSHADVRTVLASAIAALGSSLELDADLDGLFINHRNGYFKKVYLSVEKTKNLVSLATIIRELYVELPNRKNEAEAKYAAQDWAKDEFDPHVSLIYTDLSHFDNALIKTIKTRVEDYLGTSSIDVNEPGELTAYDLGWKGGIFKIVNCEGPVGEWEVLGTADIH